MEDDASIDYAKRAVRSLKTMTVPRELLEAYLTMAAVLDANGEGWKAQGYLDLAREQLDRLPQTASKTMARRSYLVAWFFYGWADRRSGMPVSAAPLMTIPVFEALVIELESSLGREHRRTLEAVDILVGCLLEAEHFAQASNLAMSLYIKCARSFGDNHVQTAYAAGKFGKANLQLDDLDSAEWGLSKAVKILSKNFPIGHQNRITFHEGLAVCLEKMGKSIEAETVREELKSLLIDRFFNVRRRALPSRLDRSPGSKAT
jgi:tetratricopeptide (TPR) repeat protein